MELTFKGKSKRLSSVYAKAENNISVPIIEYNNLKEILSSLGYYSYTIVSKKRSIYSYKEGSLTYNVMIDQISNIGNFVEFEVLTYDDYVDNNDEEVLKNKLNDVVDRFKELNFNTAHLPYRDFVAQYIYEEVLPEESLKAILFDLDGTLINSEKVFYQSFKSMLFEHHNVEINMDDYRKYELEQNASLLSHLKQNGAIDRNVDDVSFMNEVYKDYRGKFKNLINDANVILNFELIKRLKEKHLILGLVSTSRREFIDELLSGLNLEEIFDVIISRGDVASLKPHPEAYIKALEEINLVNSTSSVIAVEDSKRGIDASIEAGLKTIKTTEFNFDKQSDYRTIEIDSVTRLLFILNMHL